jgi:carbonic anhydrase/acetyltransferase-like protein (isoleucine patch superfamily)
MADIERLAPDATRIDPDAWIAPNAVVVGDVHIGAGATVWFQSVVRGDTEAIRIGARTNIQDGSVLHADPDFPCVIGEGVTVGHRCIVHGARVEDGAMVGMGSIVMNGATVGARTLVAAGSLLPEGKSYPSGVLVLGSPGRVVRELTDEEIEGLARSAAHYVESGESFRAAGY